MLLVDRFSKLVDVVWSMNRNHRQHAHSLFRVKLDTAVLAPFSSFALM